MKSSFLAVFACLALIIGAQAQTAAQPAAPAALPTGTIRLWQGAAPGALGNAPKDVPDITPYWPAPEKATGAAIVICPGGGYGGLAAHEGRDYALWLNERGIAGFVLKYRLGPAGYHHPAMLNDVQRAIRTVRSHAAEWKLNPEQIGVMGSSAGGHLASTAMTHFDLGKVDAADPVERVSSRPDIGILCYAVITMGEFTHQGSKNNLLGPAPDPDVVRLLSNELQVTKETPPCFIWHTADDGGVPVQNSLLFAQALADCKVPFEIHVYQHGPHGQGLGVRGYEPAKTDPAQLLPWTRALDDWLKSRHFAK